MPGRPHHTEKMRACVDGLLAKGHDEASAYAICTASLQGAGEPIYESEKAADGERVSRSLIAVQGAAADE